MRWLDSNTHTMDMSKLHEMVEDKGAWPVGVHRVTKSRTQLKRLPHYTIEVNKRIFLMQ